jgi:peptidoglycan hydrolase-like protein with peptidoglycan-binding domain
MMCSDQTFQEGDVGECVTEAQTLLTQLNLLMKSVDGVYDGLTKEAVRDFQGMQNLEVTGVLDPATWSLLYYVAGSS